MNIYTYMYIYIYIYIYIYTYIYTIYINTFNIAFTLLLFDIMFQVKTIRLELRDGNLTNLVIRTDIDIIFDRICNIC